MNKQPDWEKEFDDKFPPTSVFGLTLSPDIKSFIRTNFVPKQELKEWVEENKKEEIVYDISSQGAPLYIRMYNCALKDLLKAFNL